MRPPTELESLMQKTHRRFLFRLIAAALIFVSFIAYPIIGFYAVLAFYLFCIACSVLAPITRKRDWGSDGRFTRY